MNGNRVKKTTVGGNSTYYINGYDGKTEVVSHVPTGSDFTYNIWGNDLIGQVRVVGTTATRYYYLKDHLGNIRMTVNSAGNPVSWDDYYPFGSVMNGRSQISSADNRYKFTGKERDTETNYDYFGARYYDARIGRWLQVDPLASKYPEWSPYNYTLNNPIKLVDPNGKAPDDPVNVNPAQIILTQIFDVKHSVENLILVFKPAPEGMKWQADYATDEAGNEIFKTEIKLVESEGFLNDAIGYAGDALNVAGGKINDGASLLAKGVGKNQIIAAVKLTTKEITEKANELGFSRTKQFPFNSHGQPVFKKGTKYITQDLDSHNGGFWKMFDNKGKRKGTFNEDLTELFGD